MAKAPHFLVLHNFQ